MDGDDQSAEVGEGFVRPLGVLVRGEAFIPACGVPVTFTTTGGVVLSSKVAATDCQGRAEVLASAGREVGTHEVTATIGSRSATFRLTVTPKSTP
jgi:hypothetical protein